MNDDDDDVLVSYYDTHYCERHLAYQCDEIDFCNPDKGIFPALKMCKKYLELQESN